MNIIFDTNILRQDFRMKSAKFEAVLAYLRLTDSKIVLSDVVVREAVNLYKRELSTQIGEVRAIANRILRMNFDENTMVSVNCNLDTEVKAYESFLKKSKSKVDTLLLPTDGAYLDEILRRLIENIKPASEARREFRDIVIWLSIKEYLARNGGKEAVAFISANTKEFADESGCKLALELDEELSSANLKLIYFKSLEEFLKRHASKVDFITAEWIAANVSAKEIERVVYPVIARGSRLLTYAEMKEPSFAGVMAVVGINPNLYDYFVYDMHDDRIYLNLTYDAELELEIEIDTYTKDPYELEPHCRSLFGYNNAVKCLYLHITLHLSARIVEGKVIDVQLDTWDVSHFL